MNAIIDDDCEKIDKSVWLPKGKQILTPERQSMLGINVEYGESGIIKYAEVQMKSLMEFLAEKRIIDDQELFDGRTYQIWRSQATRIFRNEIMPYDPLEEKPRGDNFGEIGFVLISRRMQRHDCEIIADAIDTDSASIRKRMAELLKNDPVIHEAAHRSLSNTYRRSFARLVTVMAEVRKIIEEMKEKQITA